MKTAILDGGRPVEKVVIVVLLLFLIEFWLWLELVDRQARDVFTGMGEQVLGLTR